MERFTKVKNVGKGNMGTCALVRNNEDGRHYVIKQVDLAKLNKKERAQSLNEAKVLSVLRHPNVINYVDSFLARKTDHLCIVMEFADGGDLGIKIKNAQNVNFSEDQVLDFLIQMVLSLMHIHSRHILHRDIKTANFFLTSDGLLKLGDFGIARALDNTVDHAQTFVGTPYYLSPELILEKPYDLQSDVWAFGVCLYEVMALKHPFNAGDMKGLMQKILRVQYDPLPSCYSPELRGLVSRILVKEPSQRMKLADILKMPIVVERIRKWLAGGVLPPRYIAALVRFKLLPGFENATGPTPGGNQFTTTNTTNATSTTLPAINNNNNHGSSPQAGNNLRTNSNTSALGRYPGQNGAPTPTSLQPVTARTNSNSALAQDQSFLASLPSSSHSNAPPPFTSRPSGGAAPILGLNNNNNNMMMNPNQPRTNLPPLGNLGGGGGGGKLPMMPPPPQSVVTANTNLNINNNMNNLGQRKNSFSFPAPPPIPRQNNSNNNNMMNNNNNNNNGGNPYQHHNQFSQQQPGGLARKPSGISLLPQQQQQGMMMNKQQNQSTFPALPKLPGLPALPALGRPQPGSI